MNFTVRFEGGKELAAALAGLPERVSRKVVTEVLIDVAEPMRRRMAQLAPRGPDAPHLADNMVVTPVKRRRDEFGDLDSTVTVAVGPSRGYIHGILQEFGTVRHGAQPFARPAFDSEAEKALAQIGKRLWVELAGKGINRPTQTGTGPIGDLGLGTPSGLGAGNFQPSARGL